MAIVKPLVLPIINKQFAQDVKSIQKAIEAGIEEAAEGARRSLLQPTGTWSTPVLFEIERQGQFKYRVFTRDKRYFFVTRGTRVRRAVLSKDFIPKTTPRTLVAGPGKGRVVFVGPNVNLPGIEAREFEQQAVEEWNQLTPVIISRNIRIYTSRKSSGPRR